jgi:DNA topoisomerase-1
VARRFLATLSDAAVLEGTRVDIDVAGERFIAKGDVVVVPGFRAIYPYGLRKDEHLPALAEGESVAFLGAELEAKQTQPPARYSQGKLIQEMEKLGLGTKATRHDIIQTLYDRKYVTNDPAEPTCKGRSVIEALSQYAGEITSPEMTTSLEREMDAIVGGKSTLAQVVGHSKQALAEVVDELLPRTHEVAELLKQATDDDAKVGKCPTSGHDLLIKFSPKNRTYFVGCAGYPECSVTYPLPKNAKYQAVDEACPTCGTPQVLILQFKKRPRRMCLNPDCPTKKGPEIVIASNGCPTGDGGDLVVRYSPVGSRYVRCTNYETCGVSYPLPQQGDIEPTDERCDCGTPKVIVHTRKGPWKICIDPACPLKPARPASGARRGSGGKGRARASSSAGKAGGAGKGDVKKTARTKRSPGTSQQSVGDTADA